MNWVLLALVIWIVVTPALLVTGLAFARSGVLRQGRARLGRTWPDSGEADAGAVARVIQLRPEQSTAPRLTSQRL